MAAKEKPAKEKPKRDMLQLAIILGIAVFLIAIGYYESVRSPTAVPNATAPEIISIDNTTVVSQPLDTTEGCPLYNTDVPQTFNFQMLHKDRSENAQLMYELHYRCDCGADCEASCGYNYTELTGNAEVPIIRFSDTDVMDLLINGDVRQTFPLKCTQSQTIIYLTDEQCDFNYDCYFFGDLIAERLTYPALNGYTCDAIFRNCDRIVIAE